MLQSMGSQRVRHDLATNHNNSSISGCCILFTIQCFYIADLIKCLNAVFLMREIF